MKKTNIVNIDLGEFIWSLLEQWKCIALAAVIMAILVPAALSFYGNYNAKKEADMYSQLATLTEEEKLNTLSYDQREQVINALIQKRIVDQREEYNLNSIVARMNVSNLPVLQFKWVVSGSKDDNALNAAYGAVLTDSETVAIVKSALDSVYSETDDVYVTELITAKTGETVELCIVIPEGTDTAKIQQGIEGRIDGIKADLTADFGAHDIKLVSCEETRIVDDDRVEESILNDVNYSSFKAKYDALRLSFSDYQIAVFNSIAATDDSLTVYNNSGFEFSAKRLVIGFVAGIFLYVFCYFVYVVFSSKTRDVSVISETLDLRHLGTVSKYSYKGFAAFAHSKLVYKLRHKKTAADTNIERISNAAVVACKHNGSKKVLLVRPGMKKAYTELSDKLASKIRKDGIETKCIGSLTKDEDLTGYDSVILCVCSGGSEYAELIDTANVCDYYDKKILGGVFFN